jgi:hypothetical protein
MTNPDAQQRHLATFDVARNLITANDFVRTELIEALRLQAELDRTSNENLQALLAGGDTTATQSALDAALAAFAEFRSGFWFCLFFHLSNPAEELLRHDHPTH